MNLGGLFRGGSYDNAVVKTFPIAAGGCRKGSDCSICKIVNGVQGIGILT